MYNQFPSPTTSSTSSFSNSNVIPSPSNGNFQTSHLSLAANIVNNSGMFIHVLKDLPTLGFFALGTEKTKPNYPLLPEIGLRIVNCDRLADKCRDDDATCFLSCHIAATKRSDPTCNDIFTFSENPLNTNIKLSDLIQQNYSQDLGGSTQVVFKPKGFVLNLHDTTVYSKFTIKFQLILDYQNNNNKVLVEQISTNSFETPLMSLTLKEDFEDGTKYIIGSLANRSDDLIKQGTKKIAAPITIKFSPTLLDHFIKNVKTDLYVHFYVRGEDTDDKDSSYCLMKHERIKIKPNVYSYQIDKNLGRLDNGEKKPQKEKFRLGIVLCTKFLALTSSKFTKRMLKYKYPSKQKADPSLLYWMETKTFQSAKRQDICKPPPQQTHSAVQHGETGVVKTTGKRVHEDTSSTGSNESGNTNPVPPKLVNDLKEMLSARILNQMYHDDPEKSILLQEFIQNGKQLLEVYNQLHSSNSFRIVSYKFDRIHPREGKENTPVSVVCSTNTLHEDARFVVVFGEHVLSYSGGITSKNTIGFNVPTKPNPSQNEYIVRVVSRDAYIQVQPSDQDMIFKYTEDEWDFLAQNTTTTVVGDEYNNFMNQNGSNGNALLNDSDVFDQFLDYNINTQFSRGNFDAAMEYFEHNDIYDLVTERDPKNNKLPIENAIEFSQTEFLNRIIPKLYDYWIDELRNMNHIAKNLLSLYKDNEIGNTIKSFATLNIDGDLSTEESVEVLSSTLSPAIIISTSSDSPTPKETSKSAHTKMGRRSSFIDMISKLFAFDSNLASETTSDDLKDIMVEITNSPKQVVIPKFEFTHSKILQATEEPHYKNEEELKNLSGLRSKLERFENEVDPKGIDTIVKTLGDSSSIVTSYLSRESALPKLTVQLCLYQENQKKVSRPTNSNRSEFEDIFHHFDLSIQLNERTSICWDSARGITKIVSKASQNKLFAVFDIFTIDGKPKVSNFIQKLAMTIAYWNVNHQGNSTGQQFIESILVETGYFFTCKSLFESFSTMVLSPKSKSSEKVIRRKIKIPKELKGFTKRKWKFQHLKDTADFNESLSHFTPPQENQELATDLAKIAHGFERALLWNQQQ